VPYTYKIDKYDVTYSQYAEFLNAKDPTGANTLGLYNSAMSDANSGGINSFNGSAYTVIAGRGNHPVNFVNWYDAVRFANWLNNGQGNGDTESGAYTLLGGTPRPSNGLSIKRNDGATIFLPSENEWYKAAYYDPTTSSYFLYPTSSNSAPTASHPTALANHANFNHDIGNLTDVGAYSGTTSPYGAFDMGGDVNQWNEALINGSIRGLRGGSFSDGSGLMQSTSGRATVLGSPEFAYGNVGFRVASVPEPSTGVLAVLACGLAWWKRKSFRRVA
jgi:formylglycine-generating enzyme